MKRLWLLSVLVLLPAAPLRAGAEDGASSETADEGPAQEEQLAPPEGEGSEPGSDEEPQPQDAAANAAPGDGEAAEAEPEEKPVKEKEEPLISVKPASADGEEYDEEEGIEVAAPKKKVVATATLRKAPLKGKPAAKAAKKAGKMAPPPVLKKKAPLVAAEPPRPPAPAVPLTPITPRNP